MTATRAHCVPFPASLLQCPLKPESEPALKALADSSHQLVMITGDAPLTACFAASKVGEVVKAQTEPRQMQPGCSQGVCQCSLSVCQAGGCGGRLSNRPEKRTVFLHLLYQCLGHLTSCVVACCQLLLEPHFQ